MLLGLFSLLIFAGWMAQFLLLPRVGGGVVDPSVILMFGPTYLVGYCMLNCLLSSGEHALIFTPVEISFLFPAPVSRRQLLSYKLLSQFLATLPTSLIFLLMTQLYSRWLLAAYLGLLLILLFAQFFAIVVQQVAVSVGVRFYTQARRIVLVAGLVALVALVAYWQPDVYSGSFRDGLYDLLRSPAWQRASTPFRWFFHVFLVDKGDFAALAFYSALCVALLIALLGAIFWLDADYFETSATNSARLYARLQRLRGLAQADDTPGKKKEKQARFSLPMFPRMGGIGPILWRQLNGALHDWVKSVVALVFMVTFLIGPLMAAYMNREAEEPAFLVGCLLLGMSFIVTTMIPFDFRGDIDRMSYLKTLPLAAWRVSVGQVLAPVVLLSLIQCVIMLTCQLVLPKPGHSLFVFMLFTFPTNFLLLALENILFLLFPFRMVSGNPADIQAIGRNVLFMLAKMVVILLVAALGVCSILIVNACIAMVQGSEWSEYLLFQMKPGYVAAWFVLALSGAALIPLVALLIYALRREP